MKGVLLHVHITGKTQHFASIGILIAQNPVRKLSSLQKRIFPITPHVRLLVGRLVCQYVIISLKDGKLHIHAPIGALVHLLHFPLIQSHPISVNVSRAFFLGINLPVNIYKFSARHSKTCERRLQEEKQICPS